MNYVCCLICLYFYDCPMGLFLWFLLLFLSLYLFSVLSPYHFPPYPAGWVLLVSLVSFAQGFFLATMTLNWGFGLWISASAPRDHFIVTGAIQKKIELNWAKPNRAAGVCLPPANRLPQALCSIYKIQQLQVLQLICFASLNLPYEIQSLCNSFTHHSGTKTKMLQ